MIVFYRKLPLVVKLLMIGIIPILFLIYFSVIIYNEKLERVQLIGDHIEHIDQSANVAELINELSRERRYSYQYSVKRTGHNMIEQNRARTDSMIRLLQKSHDLAFIHFTRYTFLDRLNSIRNVIDTSKNYSSKVVVQFYTNAIVRLNSLYSTTPSSNTFLKPVYQDLIAQKILSEMITYLGIIRTNVFNALYSNENTDETLSGSVDMYKIYKTYETEFLLKASPASVNFYNNRKKITDYKTTLDYLDKLFSTLHFDSTYNVEQWLNISSDGLKVLKKQQSALWNSVDMRIKKIYQQEINSKNSMFVYLLVAILFVIIFVAYTIGDISKLLRELKLAARKISRGGTHLQLKNMPSGVIGNLAKSIVQIDKNNLLLARAANEIGKGNFNVEVRPRSDEDLLGISIKKMKRDLHELTSQKDKVQKETLELVNRRDEFFSMASHELKTPVTSLKAYTQLLLMEAPTFDNDKREFMLGKMDAQVNKLTSLINDLLDTSKLQSGQVVYTKNPFAFNELVSEIATEFNASANQQILVSHNSPVEVNADRDRIGQVLRNLLVNAIRFARDSRQIVIDIEENNEKVICSVQDFGSGIPSAEQNKIFEAYYRISGNNLHTYPGLGLGLYISKQIIERHGGKIWVKSELETGSIFYFELPVHTDPSL